jgi:hypothetical protein
MTAGMDEMTEKIVYWHRDLPPLDAEIVAEYVVEAASARVPGTFAHRDDLWYACYDDLMARTAVRLEQEVARLHGDYAHVFIESIDPCHDNAKGESWLRGRFSYVLYRSPTALQHLARTVMGSAALASL